MSTAALDQARQGTKTLHQENVVATLAQWRRTGHRAALVTLVAEDGGAPRPLGSQMAVADNGEYVGMLTGGCAEHAIVSEALAAMEKNRNRTVRYGEGSQFLDIQLPCGNGIDVFFDVTLSDSDLETLSRAERERRSAWLLINVAAGTSSVSLTAPDSSAENTFCRAFEPTARLVILGGNFVLASLMRIAREVGFLVVAYSPDHALREMLAQDNLQIEALTHADEISALFEPRTGLVSLLHAHDWEAEILAQAIRAPLFYVGALGSRRTHARRLEALSEQGCDAAQVGRIKAPIGLDIGAATPPEIAVSILAELIAAWRR